MPAPRVPREPRVEKTKRRVDTIYVARAADYVEEDIKLEVWFD